jgi:hypothetical protein
MTPARIAHTAVSRGGTVVTIQLECTTSADARALFFDVTQQLKGGGLKVEMPAKAPASTSGDAT